MTEKYPSCRIKKLTTIGANILEGGFTSISDPKKTNISCVRSEVRQVSRMKLLFKWGKTPEIWLTNLNLISFCFIYAYIFMHLILDVCVLSYCYWDYIWGMTGLGKKRELTRIDSISKRGYLAKQKKGSIFLVKKGK